MADNPIDDIPAHGDAEEWRAVSGLEGLYEVSSLGRIRSLDRVVIKKVCFPGRLMQGSASIGGYRKVTLRGANGRAVTRNIHVLVAEAFHGPRPQGHVVAHGNGVPSDNRSANLRYATQAENTADRWLHGTEPAGEKNPSARLNENDVRLIRSSSLSDAELGHMFGVAAGHIKNVRRGTVWKLVS